MQPSLSGTGRCVVAGPAGCEPERLGTGTCIALAIQSNNQWTRDSAASALLRQVEAAEAHMLRMLPPASHFTYGT